MHRSSSHVWLIFVACLAALFVTSASAPLWAAPKDKAALKLYDEAMDEDYLNTLFDDAIGKLDKAVDTCGKSGCSSSVLSKIHVGRGVVYGGGKNDTGAAKKAFVAAFKADKNAKPLDDFMTDDLKKLFADAKNSSGGDDDDDDKPAPKPVPSGDDDDDDDDDAPAAGGDMDYEPPAEALVNHPLPIYLKVPEDLEAGSVTLRYKPFGGAKWLKVIMKQKAGGWAGVVPCKEITTTGELKFFILVKDNQGDAMATAGTRRAPLVVEIRNAIDGDQPALPGEKPPAKCAAAADCPPDFPGCSSGGGVDGGEGKGWGASCEEKSECRKGLTCLNGVCEQGEGDDDDDDDDDDGGSDDGVAKNLFFLGPQIDLLLLNSQTDVCGTAPSATGDWTNRGAEENYFCYRNDSEYLGKPADGLNEVQGGIGMAGIRILAGYDRILWKGLAAGARIGFAVSFTPGQGDAENNFEDCKDAGGTNCHPPVAGSFLPLHLEGRAAYYFPDPKGFVDGLVRPYGFVGGGLAQVNAGVPVGTCDLVDDNGADASTDGGGSQCPANTTKREDVDAVQFAGLGFVGFGAGAIFAFHDNIGVNAEVKFMYLFPGPTTGFVIAPFVAPVFMF